MRIGSVAARGGADLQLVRRCERALAATVRSALSRQQARQAARRFVRRYRRDARHLEWALHCAAASTALAAALLGLRAEPAIARTTFFDDGIAFPALAGVDVGLASAPSTGDLDGDGDLDLVSGRSSGGFVFLENTGSPAFPAFVQRTGSANPLDGEDAGSHATPALGDLDGDGDLDLVSGDRYGFFRYFENTGSATLPAFVARNGVDHPLDGLGISSAPALADLDRDGDLDSIAGTVDGVFGYYENTGSATLPAFVERTGSANPLFGRVAGSYAVPALADLDADGDVDLIAGTQNGTFAYYENSSPALAPAFTLGDELSVSFDAQDVGSYAAPALGDFDGDGDADLVAGDGAGSFTTLANRAGDFARLYDDDNFFAGIPSIVDPRPALGDLDADGDLDLVEGDDDGNFHYWQNTGDETSPAFVERTGAANPLTGQSTGLRATPTLGDLDADGDLDLLAPDLIGQGFFYFENTGNAALAAFVQRTGSANPLQVPQPNIADSGQLALADLDADGDLDALADASGFTGSFRYFENTGSAALAAFVQRTGTANPLDGQGNGNPALCDFDGDLDLDLVAGDRYGEFRIWENTGSASTPAFVALTGSANPLVGEGVLYRSTPACGDLDGDGDVDLASGSDNRLVAFDNAILQPTERFVDPIFTPFAGVDVGGRAAPAAGDLDADGDADFAVGSSSGEILFFENTGVARMPQLVQRSGVANPFAGLAAGASPRLALADLDADGDLDLATGDRYGNGLRFFENTGSATAPAYAARTGSANPLASVITYQAAPAFGDLDGDGDLDVAVGESPGFVQYLENTGDAEAPVFVQRTGSANPLGGIFGALWIVPAFSDVDRDGDLDLVIGGLNAFHYYENTGSVLAPQFALQASGAGVPESAPTLADLDGDGDPDLVSGRQDGGFTISFLPEPGAASLVGAGAGLLAWLARWRGRRRRTLR